MNFTLAQFIARPTTPTNIGLRTSLSIYSEALVDASLKKGALHARPVDILWEPKRRHATLFFETCTAKTHEVSLKSAFSYFLALRFVGEARL
jgi:hypothetical protein